MAPRESPLSRLPSSVRLQIFNHSIESYCFTVCYTNRLLDGIFFVDLFEEIQPPVTHQGDFVDRGWNKRRRFRRNEKPYLLCTCKQIRGETLRLFYAKLRLRISGEDPRERADFTNDGKRWRRFFDLSESGLDWNRIQHVLMYDWIGVSNQKLQGVIDMFPAIQGMTMFVGIYCRQRFREPWNMLGEGEDEKDPWWTFQNSEDRHPLGLHNFRNWLEHNYARYWAQFRIRMLGEQEELQMHLWLQQRPMMELLLDTKRKFHVLIRVCLLRWNGMDGSVGFTFDWDNDQAFGYYEHSGSLKDKARQVTQSLSQIYANAVPDQDHEEERYSANAGFWEEIENQVYQE